MSEAWGSGDGLDPQLDEDAADLSGACIGGVLLLAEDGGDGFTGGVVDSAQQAPPWTGWIWIKPAVRTVIQLEQHAFGGHALTPCAMRSRAAGVRAAKTGRFEDAPHTGH